MMVRREDAAIFGVLALMVVVGLSVLATACVQLGLTQPDTFNQRLAYAYAGVTSARISAYNGLKGGQITVADANHVLQATDQARTALDDAHVLQEKVGATPDAIKQLAFAEAILVGVQQLLSARASEGKVGGTVEGGSK